MHTSRERQSMKTTSAALSLASVLALLLTDHAAGFLPTAAQAGVKCNSRWGTRSAAPAFVARTAGAKRRPIAAAARMVVGGGETKKLELETSDKLPRGPAGAIKLT